MLLWSRKRSWETQPWCFRLLTATPGSFAGLPGSPKALRRSEWCCRRTTKLLFSRQSSVRCPPRSITSTLSTTAVTTRLPRIAIEIYDPRVTYIRHETNLGVGGAVVTGYRRALVDGCDFVVKMDADGQMNAAEIERLLAPLLFGVADYVKGSRFYVAGSNRSMPRVRRLGSVALSFMTKVSTGYWHVFDSQCGFTAVRSSYLRLLAPRPLAKDYFFENSMLLWLNVYNARVVDMPVTTIYGEETSGIRYRRVFLRISPAADRGLVEKVHQEVLPGGFRCRCGAVLVRDPVLLVRDRLRCGPLVPLGSTWYRYSHRHRDDCGSRSHSGHTVAAPGPSARDIGLSGCRYQQHPQTRLGDRSPCLRKRAKPTAGGRPPGRPPSEYIPDARAASCRL